MCHSCIYILDYKQKKMKTPEIIKETITEIINDTITILIFGRTSVGKSSTINKLLGQKLLFTSNSQSTLLPSIITNGKTNVTTKKNKKDNTKIGVNNIQSNNYNVDLSIFCDKTNIREKDKINIIDFPGVTTINNINYPFVNLLTKFGALFNTIVFYITDPAKIDEESCSNDLRYITSKCKNVFILLNKTDNEDEDDEEDYQEKIKEYKMKIYKLTLKFKCDDSTIYSSKTGYNIGYLYKIISKQYESIIAMKKKILANIYGSEIPVTILSSYFNNLEIKLQNREFSNTVEGSIILSAIGGISFVSTGIGIVAAVATGGLLAGFPIYTTMTGITLSANSVKDSIDKHKKIKLEIINCSEMSKILKIEFPSFENIEKYIQIASKKINIIFTNKYEDYKYIKVEDCYFKVSGIFEKTELKELINIIEITN